MLSLVLLLLALAAAPSSDELEPTVMGSLDKELIRHVVQANRGQIRVCYEGQLPKFPTLKGKVSVKFIISPSGAVASAMPTDSTTGNAELDTSVVEAVRRWVFPRPRGGGVVIVVYPFAFNPK